MKTTFEFERDRAYHRLVELLFGGGAEAGAPLSERKLAEQLGMGRMPVREALRQLEQEGVVEVRPARGTFLRQLSPDDLADIFRVREALECLAARLAASRGPTPALDACGVRLRSMARDASAFTAVEIDDAGTAFHEHLVEASGNDALKESIRLLRLRGRLAFHLPRYFGHEIVQATLDEHILILEAVEQRTPRAAGRLMRAHLRSGLDIRLKLESAAAQKRRNPGEAQPGKAPNNTNKRTSRGTETIG